MSVTFEGALEVILFLADAMCCFAFLYSALLALATSGIGFITVGYGVEVRPK